MHILCYMVAVLCVVGGLIMGGVSSPDFFLQYRNESIYALKQSIALYWVISGILSGVIIGTFGRIVHLLEIIAKSYVSETPQENHKRARVSGADLADPEVRNELGLPPLKEGQERSTQKEGQERSTQKEGQERQEPRLGP